MPTLPASAVGGLYSRRRQQVRRDHDKNIMSGVVSIIVIVVVCACLSQPQWFWLDGGGCSTHTIGLYMFFHPGEFQATEGTTYSSSTPHLIYYANGHKLKFCVTPEIVTLMRVVIGLIFVMICASLIQMMLDITGPTGRILKCVRKNAVAGIISVLVCVVCVGVCYYITTLIEKLQEATKPVTGPAASARVQIKLDVGFYLLIFAGGMSVMAVGCSWLRPAHIFQDGDAAPLVEEWGGLEGMETFSVPPGSSLGPYLPYLHDMEPPPPVEGHPPPPYTP
ncbi:transmembrane protein 127-like [Penaeus chinensis]|uniref:transmembrane protein 127-like n=1 Tax=Penaeus chinensis TaxID=139456 RepID=UPI001FB7E133|nr:transmembrane protein 127-like [Penaeus chinensis]XP_047482019.1 transmembrane protein 127-like [Penaeus chinensis]